MKRDFQSLQRELKWTGTASSTHGTQPCFHGSGPGRDPAVAPAGL